MHVGCIKATCGNVREPSKEARGSRSCVFRNLPYSTFLFVNFLIEITPFCDCGEFDPEYISPKIGVLASNNIVAVDLATIDLIGKDKFDADPTVQVREAHKLGLGKLEYTIVRV